MKEKIKVIGLCGRSGSGKGYVCEAFFDLGIPSIDTDKVYREILDKEGSPCLAELTRRFGDGILDERGKLCRPFLAAIVFADTEKLSALNGITHKYIHEETVKLIEKASDEGKRAVIIDAPVLFESGFDSLCDVTLCVTAPEGVCVERICERDGRTKKEAIARLSSQKSAAELRELCDFEIINDGKADVNAQVIAFFERYIAKESKVNQ